jgi:hypothetical protein
MQFEVKAKEYSDSERMASDYLAKYYIMGIKKYILNGLA